MIVVGEAQGGGECQADAGSDPRRRRLVWDGVQRGGCRSRVSAVSFVSSVEPRARGWALRRLDPSIIFRGTWSLFGARPCGQSRAQADLCGHQGTGENGQGHGQARSDRVPVWTLPSCQLPTSQSCPCPQVPFTQTPCVAREQGRGCGFCPQAPAPWPGLSLLALSAGTCARKEAVPTRLPHVGGFTENSHLGGGLSWD